MFIGARNINQPHRPWTKWRASSSKGKKPSDTFPRSWTAMNRSGIDDSGSIIPIGGEITACWGPKELGATSSGDTGSPMLADYLFFIGQRIVNIERAFKTVYAYFSRADDMPPRIFVDEPIKSGWNKGERLDLGEMWQILEKYNGT